MMQLVGLLAVAVAIVAAAVAWRPARYQIVNAQGSMGWVMDTQTGRVDGIVWKDGLIRPGQ